MTGSEQANRDVGKTMLTEFIISASLVKLCPEWPSQQLQDPQLVKLSLIQKKEQQKRNGGVSRGDQ